MRYNQEAVKLASRQSVANKEGQLRHKPPNEKGYKDRAVRINGNLLFIFKLDDTKTRIEKEPCAWLLLEDIVIKVEQYADEQFVFSIVCGSDVHYFSAPFQQVCNDWVAGIQAASLTHLQMQMRSLCRVIEQRTRRDPMSDIVERIASGGSLKKPKRLSPNPASLPSTTLQPSRRAPPPPPAPPRQAAQNASAPQQSSTWFTELQTLDALNLGQSNKQASSSSSSQGIKSSSSASSVDLLSLQPERMVQAPVVMRPHVTSPVASNTQWHVGGPLSPSLSSLPGPLSTDPFGASFQPAVTSFQPSVTSFQPSVTSFQPPAVSFKSSTASFQPSAAFQSSTASFQPPAASFQSYADPFQHSTIGASARSSLVPSSSQPSRMAPPPPSSTRGKRTSATWFTDLEDTSQKTLDPFGMDPSFHQTPLQSGPMDPFQGLIMEKSNIPTNPQSDQPKPMDFKWQTFE